jgi:RNA polymerase sigma-70 factor (ECF subfamily)
MRVIHNIVGSPDEADDICQDTFAVLWEQRGSIDVNKNINAFVFLIAKRITYKHLRKSRCADDLCDIPDDDAHLDCSPEEIMRTKEMEFLVRHAIDSLSPRTREIYDLHYTEGLTYAQIAERLDINAANVKAKIHQARAKMRDILASLIAFLSL